MKIGIIGSGTMGVGIAEAILMESKHEVNLCNVRLSSLDKARDNICRYFEHLVQKGIITAEAMNDNLSRLHTGTLMICDDCDIVIESVPENLEVKRMVFRDLSRIAKKDCLFASNTSSLSISKLEEGLDRPVVGMHFFNPARKMKLVEVIRGEATPQELVDKAMSFAVAIGKTPIEAKEYPGFVVNRILIPMINEAINVYAEGTATAEDIDIAMQLGASHPMGPLHLADLIGLDICLAIMEVIYAETDDSKYAPCPLLYEMVEDGKLGRKTGTGFFTY